MRTRAPSRVGSFVLAAFVTSSLPCLPRFEGRAHADAASANEEIAKDLFDKGVAKMEKATCDEKPKDAATCKEARDDFRRAYELAPNALGALRNLAYVEKGLGMVSSAARDFRELARKAPLDPKPERHKWADYAKKEVEELTPRVPHMTVKVADRPAGTKVTLDGSPLLEAAWDTEIDVDPGEHAVHAEAPGRLPFEGTLVIAERQSKSIAVLLPIDVAPPKEEGAKHGPPVVPIVVSAVGLATVGVGLGLGYASMKKKSDACGSDHLCDPDGLRSGKSLANASTIVTSVGGVLLVGGVVWWLLSPSSSSTEGSKSAQFTPYFGPGGAGVAAFGRF